MNPGIYIKQADLNNFEKNINKILKAETDGKTKLLLSQAKLVQARIKEKAPVGPTGNLKKATYAIAYPETLSSSAVAFAGIRPRKRPMRTWWNTGMGDRTRRRRIPSSGRFVTR